MARSSSCFHRKHKDRHRKFLKLILSHSQRFVKIRCKLLTELFQIVDCTRLFMPKRAKLRLRGFVHLKDRPSHEQCLDALIHSTHQFKKVDEKGGMVGKIQEMGRKFGKSSGHQSIDSVIGICILPCGDLNFHSVILHSQYSRMESMSDWGRINRLMPKELI